MSDGIQRWRGRSALVTGASSGIGWASAIALGRAGLKVAVTARRRDRLDALVMALRDLGAEAFAVPCDARCTEMIPVVFEEIRQRWGGTDVLINSAGLGREAPLIKGPVEGWREMLEVNVLALAAFTAEAVQDMRDRGGEGQIIHISSMSGHRTPVGGGGMYSATKFAVRAMTEGLRTEVRAAQLPIRVAAISPGFVETEFAEAMSGDPQQAAELYSRFPCLQPEDVAASVMHCLAAPPHAQIHDILMRPTAQES